MLTISDQFSAKRYSRGWELHHKQPSDNPKSKTGFKTDVTYYATLRLLCEKILDISMGKCAAAVDIKGKILEAMGEIERITGSVDSD